MGNVTKAARAWPVFLLFSVLAVALAAAGWHAISAVNFEAGDFAANSLLIQDAKKLQLVYGNYSRVGFNHPGPAILYVLAAGELLFHDVLHAVPSPFSGQLLAVCLYNAAWMALIVALVRRVTGSFASALLFLAAALAVLAYEDYQVFTGIWFPHLYLFPFAAMLVALARLVHGETDMLRPLAVATGFLVNGHASFVAISGVMLVVVLAANAVLTRHDRARTLLTRAFLRTHAREIRIACGILFLFFVPLIVATVKDWPGPLYQYFKFGRANKGNTLREAFGFVAVYWGQGIAMAWGMLLLALCVKGVPDAQARRPVRALAIALLAATLALLYYAKAGVDQLDQVYIGLFYYAVPAFAASLAALAVWGPAPRGRALLLAWLAIAIGLGVAWQRARKPLTYEHHYRRPGVAALYDELRALPGKGRIVLDLERTPQSGAEVWGDVLALHAYAARRTAGFLCVNREWDISNTRPGRCRPEELGNERRFLVRGSEAIAQAPPDIAALGIALYRVGGAPAPGRYTAVKDRPDLYRELLGEGWSYIEDGFVWTAAPVAHLRLPADARRTGDVTLDLLAFLPRPDLTQRVSATVNGKPAGSWTFTAREQRQLVRLPLGGAAAGTLDIALAIADPKSPQQLGLSTDTRPLGVALFGIRTGERP